MVSWFGANLFTVGLGSYSTPATTILSSTWGRPEQNAAAARCHLKREGPSLQKPTPLPERNRRTGASLGQARRLVINEQTGRITTLVAVMPATRGHRHLLARDNAVKNFNGMYAFTNVPLRILQTLHAAPVLVSSANWLRFPHQHHHTLLLNIYWRTMRAFFCMRTCFVLGDIAAVSRAAASHTFFQPTAA